MLRLVFAHPVRRLCSTTAVEKDAGEPASEAISWAFNDLEKKKGSYKPKHTVDEQIRYMQSKTYEAAYKGRPVHRWYRRNLRCQPVLQPPPRMFCIDKAGRFNVNHACPICRDEYLFFDYRNPALIEQFLIPGTDQPRPILRTGLCREQYMLLEAQLLKAKEHGTIEFAVPFRNFDYTLYYPWWPANDHVFVRRSGLELHEVRANRFVEFPVHNRDKGNDWDEWWKRHDLFARKGQ